MALYRPEGWKNDTMRLGKLGIYFHNFLLELVGGFFLCERREWIHVNFSFGPPQFQRMFTPIGYCELWVPFSANSMKHFPHFFSQVACLNDLNLPYKRVVENHYVIMSWLWNWNGNWGIGLLIFWLLLPNWMEIRYWVVDILIVVAKLDGN
jgi:hypothetical protein